MQARRIIPTGTTSEADGAESLDAWGFRDSAFTVLPNGVELPSLLPWIRRVMEIELPPSDTHAASYPPEVPPSRDHLPFLHDLRRLLADDAISDDPLIRLRHGHGHTLEEMYAVLHGKLERVPDLVGFPST